jgi:uncharacterized repeat protein (TIGR01451 family)
MNLKVKTLKKLLMFSILSLLLIQVGCHNGSSRSMQTMSTTESTHSALFKIRKQYVSGSMVGGEYKYLLEVIALEDVGNVVIEETLPNNVRFVKSNPAAKLDGNTIFWAFPGMNKGETKEVELYYSPEMDGAFKVCTVVSGDPRLCVALVAGMPNLKVEKTGPAVIELGEEAVWLASVTNMGTATAEKVRLVDDLPDGLEAVSATEYDLGDIAPGQTKQVKVVAKALKAGNYTNTATAMFKDTKTQVKGSSALEIIESKISVIKEGPAMAYVLSPATYTITVRNVGMHAVEDLKVVDTLPEFVNVVESGGGMLSRNEIAWKIDRLEPAQSKTYNVRFAANNPGETVSKVTVWNKQGLEENAEVRTKWQSAPGIHMSIMDQKDPLQVGQSTVYQIRVLNQGSFDPVSASIRVVLSDELKPTKVQSSSPNTISGQEVVFSNISIEPGKEVTAQITAQGVKTGRGSAVMQLKADFLPKVLVSEESTTVY